MGDILLKLSQEYVNIPVQHFIGLMFCWKPIKNTEMVQICVKHKNYIWNTRVLEKDKNLKRVRITEKNLVNPYLQNLNYTKLQFTNYNTQKIKKYIVRKNNLHRTWEARNIRKTKKARFDVSPFDRFAPQKRTHWSKSTFESILRHFSLKNSIHFHFA